MKIAEQNINLKEAIKRWDAGETVWSVERGGLGPGYEQAIQVGVFELAKIMLNDTLPKDNDELNKLFDKKLIDLIHTRKHPILKGLSGAQASAIKVLVYQFLSIGYEETLKDAKDYGVDLIQVEKNIPQSEIKVEVEDE